jgi:hypothetical protein
MTSYGKSMFPHDYLAAQKETRMSDTVDRMARDEGWGKVTDFVLQISPSDVETQARKVARYCADMIRERDEAKRERDEALEYTQAIRDHCMKERDEARAKAIDEAAATFRNNAPGAMLAGDVDRIEAAVLALKDKP